MGLTIIAAISGESMVSVIVTLVIVGLVFFILDWAVTKIGIGEPFNKVIRVVLILAAALFVINALLSLVGHPFIRW